MAFGEIYRPESFISPASECGLLRAATPDRTVWLYARIPWSTALLDGASDQKRIDANDQLMAFFDGLAGQVTVAGMRYRYMLKADYREFHLLSGSMPIPYQIPSQLRQTDLGAYQSAYYKEFKTRKQFAVIGVPLKLTGGGERPRGETLLQRGMKAYDHMCYSIANGCATFEEYLADAHVIERIMLNAGLEPFTLMDVQERGQLVAMMESWWVSRANASALPIIAENDHVHFFPDSDVCRTAKNLYDDGIDCNEWNLRQEYPASICFARSSNFQQTPVSSAANLWVAKLLEVGNAGGANAVGVSIRGKVEPAKVTQDQIRRNSRTIDESIKERYQKGHEATGDMNDIKRRLDYKKSIYESPDMPPTLIDLSIAACVGGTSQMAIDSLSKIPNIEFTNLTTANEQLIAFKSMQACSPIRMTPYELHWTATSVSGAGSSSLARAGDESGALAGLTEANLQPVYIGTTTVQDKDRKPILAIIGDTGSGKTMLAFSLFLQWSKIDARDGKGKTPCIYINPKAGNDLEDATLSQKGTVIRLDKDIANGTFDPFNVIPNVEEAKEIAVLMMTNILGGDIKMETAMTAMLDYGVKHGARCVGVAISTAAKAVAEAIKEGKKPEEIGLPSNSIEVYQTISMNLKANQGLRLIFGTNNSTKPLSISQNLTLVNAGERSLIPEGTDDSMTARIRQWTLRMVVMGAGTAVRGRDGMVGVDEAWVFMGKDKGASRTFEQWVRMARSQQFTPVIISQKVQEFIDADLTGGISRAFLLALDNPAEDNGTVSPAKSAERLLGIDDPNGHILKRMSADDMLDNNQPNWQSLKRLVKGRVVNGRFVGDATIRGSIAYFKDGSKQPVPVQIIIPPELLKEISTTATDKIAREQLKNETSATS